MAQLSDTSLISDANLQWYYQLENVNATTGGLTLTNNNSVAFSAAKYNNGADGGSSNSTKSLTYSGNNNIDMNGAFSVAFWVKINAAPSSGNTYRLLDVRNTTSGARYFLIQYTNGGGTLRIDANLSSGTIATYNVDLGTTLFHHLAMTVTAGGTVQIYVDGVAVGTTGTRGTDTIPSGGIGVLSDPGNASQWSSAILDDLAGFNRLLLQADINLLFNAAGGGARPARNLFFSQI